MNVKVCGITQLEQAKALKQMQLNYMGFIFYPKSKRYVINKIEIDFEQTIPVGVFVNASIEEIIIELKKVPAITTLQLHGNESPTFCAQLQNDYTIIKAFSIDDTVENINDLTQPYELSCDYFLFDTKTPNYGGSGKQFDWQILSTYNGKLPFILSGGISEFDVQSINNLAHPNLYAIDINSKFEILPGEKDIEKIKTFIKQIK